MLNIQPNIITPSLNRLFFICIFTTIILNLQQDIEARRGPQVPPIVYKLTIAIDKDLLTATVNEAIEGTLALSG